MNLKKTNFFFVTSYFIFLFYFSCFVLEEGNKSSPSNFSLVSPSFESSIFPPFFCTAERLHTPMHNSHLGLCEVYSTALSHFCLLFDSSNSHKYSHYYENFLNNSYCLIIWVLGDVVTPDEHWLINFSKVMEKLINRTCFMGWRINIGSLRSLNQPTRSCQNWHYYT